MSEPTLLTIYSVLGTELSAMSKLSHLSSGKPSRFILLHFTGTREAMKLAQYYQ